jgi:hypothetical protein
MRDANGAIDQNWFSPALTAPVIGGDMSCS